MKFELPAHVWLDVSIIDIYPLQRLSIGRTRDSMSDTERTQIVTGAAVARLL